MSIKKVMIWLSLSCFFYCLYSAGCRVAPKSVLKESIETPAGVRVVKNPREPRFGELILELEEDLSIGRQDDERYRFKNSIITPQGIQVDRYGNIFVLDIGSRQIKKYDKAGTYLQTIGRGGYDPGEFLNLFSMAMDADDNLYVNDSISVQVFNNQGQLKKRTDIPYPPLLRMHIGITREKNFVLDTGYLPYGPEELGLYSSDGRKLKTITTFVMPQGASGTDEFSRKVPSPWHLYFCCISEDRMVFGNSYEYKLNVANSAGNSLFIIEKEERPELRPFFDEIRSDDLGNIYVRRISHEGQGLARVPPFYDLFNKNGRYLYRIRWPFKLSQNFKLGLIKSGYLYRSDQVSGSRDDQRNRPEIMKRYKIKNWDALKRAASQNP